MRDAIVVEHDDAGERHGIERGSHEKSAAQTDQPGQHAANHRSDGGAEPLRRLHQSDGRRHPLPRRRLRGHGQGQRSIAGEQALHDSQGEHVPGRRHVRHRRHDDDKADQRALDHDLAAKAITETSPGGREQRGQSRRHRQTDAGPHRDLAHVGDAKLADVERQKRHGQREPGVAHEGRGGHRGNVPLPRVGTWRGSQL